MRFLAGKLVPSYDRCRRPGTGPRPRPSRTALKATPGGAAAAISRMQDVAAQGGSIVSVRLGGYLLVHVLVGRRLRFAGAATKESMQVRPWQGRWR
jgi:hypothetical protein